jgi:hypothetical protein
MGDVPLWKYFVRHRSPRQFSEHQDNGASNSSEKVSLSAERSRRSPCAAQQLATDMSSAPTAPQQLTVCFGDMRASIELATWNFHGSDRTAVTIVSFEMMHWMGFARPPPASDLLAGPRFPILRFRCCAKAGQRDFRKTFSESTRYWISCHTRAPNTSPTPWDKTCVGEH